MTWPFDNGGRSNLDPFGLKRFVMAQDGSRMNNAASNFHGVIRELSLGQKFGHWMWYIFPQIAGLGHSENAKRYAISSKEEAVAYLEHLTLGPRYADCLALATTWVLAHLRHNDAWTEIVMMFGQTDAMKFKSSVTLFGNVAQSIDHPIAGMIAENAQRLFDAGLRPCKVTTEWLAENK